MKNTTKAKVVALAILSTLGFSSVTLAAGANYLGLGQNTATENTLTINCNNNLLISTRGNSAILADYGDIKEKIGTLNPASCRIILKGIDNHLDEKSVVLGTFTLKLYPASSTIGISNTQFQALTKEDGLAYLDDDGPKPLFGKPSFHIPENELLFQDNTSPFQTTR